MMPALLQRRSLQSCKYFFRFKGHMSSHGQVVIGRRKQKCGLTQLGSRTLCLLINRPFSSSKNSHFQNEAKCKRFLVKMSFICMRVMNHFYINSFANPLDLKQRLVAIRNCVFLHGRCGIWLASIEVLLLVFLYKSIWSTLESDQRLTKQFGNNLLDFFGKKWYSWDESSFYMTIIEKLQGDKKGYNA